jgi:hypothetical protein
MEKILGQNSLVWVFAQYKKIVKNSVKSPELDSKGLAAKIILGLF